MDSQEVDLHRSNNQFSSQVCLGNPTDLRIYPHLPSRQFNPGFCEQQWHPYGCLARLLNLSHRL